MKDYTNSQIVTQKEAIYEEFLKIGDPEILKKWERFVEDNEILENIKFASDIWL